MLKIAIESNPLDHVPAGQQWAVPEGQTRIVSPMTIQQGGELLVADGAHLILESSGND